MPDKTFAEKGKECKGGKLAKERVTFMMCCSCTGEKLKPLVIGKARKPRCFGSLDPSNLPVIWRSNKKSWMTGETFKDWIFGVNKEMKRQSRKILLFLDNATSHPHDLKLSNITLKYFPPNTTSKLQPLDLGIIRAFKARYRKRMMGHLLSKMDTCKTAAELTRNVSVLDAIHWINKAWDETKQTTIESCFRDAGFPVETTESLSSEISDDDDDLPLSILKTKYEMADENNLDIITDTENDLETEETYDGDWETTILSEYKNDNTKNTSSDSEDSGDEIIQSDLTYNNVLDMLREMGKFAIAKDARYFESIQYLTTLTEETLIKQRLNKKQTTIDTFFTKPQEL
ncbi:tigger transposable element-derived protein 6-like [Saccostrea cucullata]|uniref:tigger transposable element-derived protein 6-like n=1 Tax=Saccostrea cuccullata TaxID=36930 RepID=UPI002ED23DAB